MKDNLEPSARLVWDADTILAAYDLQMKQKVEDAHYRKVYAAAALTGLLAKEPSSTVETVAVRAFSYADAMLKESKQWAS